VLVGDDVVLYASRDYTHTHTHTHHNKLITVSALIIKPTNSFTNYFVTQGVFSKHTLYIDSTSYPLGKSASGGRTRRHPPVVSWAEQESCRHPKRARVTTLVNPIHRPLIVNFVKDALHQHILHRTASCQVTRDPLHHQATRTVPRNFITHICRVLRATLILSPTTSKYLPSA